MVKGDEIPMAKIGILTLYDENYNYGGILQACALCNVLNNMGTIVKCYHIAIVLTLSIQL